MSSAYPPIHSSQYPGHGSKSYRNFFFKRRRSRLWSPVDESLWIARVGPVTQAPGGCDCITRQDDGCLVCLFALGFPLFSSGFSFFFHLLFFKTCSHGYALWGWWKQPVEDNHFGLTPRLASRCIYYWATRTVDNFCRDFFWEVCMHVTFTLTTLFDFCRLWCVLLAVRVRNISTSLCLLGNKLSLKHC